jgi:hypothetical protein
MAGVIRTEAVGVAETATSVMVTFDPALAATIEPGAGVGACHVTAPASPRAVVPGTSRTAAQIATNSTKPAF